MGVYVCMWVGDQPVGPRPYLGRFGRGRYGITVRSELRHPRRHLAELLQLHGCVCIVDELPPLGERVGRVGHRCPRPLVLLPYDRLHPFVRFDERIFLLPRGFTRLQRLYAK